MSACEIATGPEVDVDDEEFSSMLYDRLPFVVPTNDVGRLFWAPRPTGSYNYDCTLGQQYAFAALPMLTHPGGFQLLCWIVMDMLKHGDVERDRGVIVGMMGEIGKVLENARR